MDIERAGRGDIERAGRGDMERAGRGNMERAGEGNMERLTWAPLADGSVHKCGNRPEKELPRTLPHGGSHGRSLPGVLPYGPSWRLCLEEYHDPGRSKPQETPAGDLSSKGSVNLQAWASQLCDM